MDRFLLIVKFLTSISYLSLRLLYHTFLFSSTSGEAAEDFFAHDSGKREHKLSLLPFVLILRIEKLPSSY